VLRKSSAFRCIAQHFSDGLLVLLGHKILAGFTLSRAAYSEEI
jgi:hypothetical protein